MSKDFLKLSAAVAIIVATPTLASAQSVAYGTSPVAITSCGFNESYESGMIGGELAMAPQFVASSIALNFVNKSGVPATSVTFLVNDGKNTQGIVDKGTFRSGVQIKHSFAAGSAIGTFSNATCNVAEVDFADGSAWHVARGDLANR